MTVDALYHWLNETFPFLSGNEILIVLAILIPSVALFMVIAVNALVLVYAERKVSAFMQDRVGPMGQGVGLHAGKWGLLQTVADALKLISKEDIIPRLADRKLFIMAPFVIFVGAFIAVIALPFGETIIIADMNIGIFYILAVSSFGVIGLILAGWSSNNKWSLYGGMRSAAQIISYEIPAGLSLITVIMLTETLSMQGIIQYQSGGLFSWIVFSSPFSFIAFIVYFIAAIAETNRTPFDIPEAESELVGGFHTEYSGMRWSFFFLSEYANMLVVCGVAVTGFLGGWQSPIPGYFNTAGWSIFWFISKILFLVFVMMWVRWTFPRLRVDQLMDICWKYLLPIALFNIFGVGIWTLIFG